MFTKQIEELAKMFFQKILPGYQARLFDKTTQVIGNNNVVNNYSNQLASNTRAALFLKVGVKDKSGIVVTYKGLMTIHYLVLYLTFHLDLIPVPSPNTSSALWAELRSQLSSAPKREGKWLSVIWEPL